MHKTVWLRSEILQRIIQELLVDYYVKTQDTNITSEDKKVRWRRLGRSWLPARPLIMGSEGKCQNIKKERDWSRGEGMCVLSGFWNRKLDRASH